jgi:hypothetical protein
MHGASVPKLTCLIPCDHHRTRGSAACWHARPREGAQLEGKLMFVQEKRSGASLVRFVVPKFVPTGPPVQKRTTLARRRCARAEPPVCLEMKPAVEGPTSGTNGLDLRSQGGASADMRKVNRDQVPEGQEGQADRSERGPPAGGGRGGPPRGRRQGVGPTVCPDDRAALDRGP